MGDLSLHCRNFPTSIQVSAINLSVRRDGHLILLFQDPLGHCEIRIVALERRKVGAGYAKRGMFQETSNRVGGTLVDSGEGSELVDSILIVLQGREYSLAGIRVGAIKRNETGKSSCRHFPRMAIVGTGHGLEAFPVRSNLNQGTELV